MTDQQTPRSTRRLSEVARHVVYPADIVSTGWPEVEAKLDEIGIKFYVWQVGLATLILGKRADGKYAATVGGVALSIPRQVAKTFLVSAIIFALCLIHPNLTVLWTAHRTRTSNETFRKLKGMAARAKIKPHVLAIRSVNGEQEITFRNGSRIMFGAREQGFGRGFTEVDIEVFDEAQILTEKALEDMIAAMNQSRFAAGALLFLMGTPPRPIDPGEVFENKRARALANNAEGMIYVEMSADEDADPDDREQWLKANPSYPDHTSEEAMLRMRSALSDDAFLREALGVWNPSRAAVWVVPEQEWTKAEDVAPPPRQGQITLALDTSPKGDQTAVAACAARADGKWQVEVLYQAPGTAWVPAWLAEQVESGKVRAVVYDAQCAPLTAIADDLRRAGIVATVTDWGDMKAACAGFMGGIVGGQVRHSGQHQLTNALAHAGKRDVEGGWAWSRRNPRSDITPIVAATLAVWGARSRRTKKASAGSRASRTYATRTKTTREAASAQR